MQRLSGKRLLRAGNIVLRTASLIVPRAQRSAWLGERQTQIWHWVHFLVDSGRLNAQSEREVARHCLQSFSDALWCRFNRKTVLAFLRSYPATPSFCLVCVILPLVVVLLARPWPLRSAFHSFITTKPILTVTLDRDSHWLEPELLMDAAADWTKIDSAIAGAETYAWRSSVVAGPGGKQFVSSARITHGVLQVLKAKLALGRSFVQSDVSACSDCVVLSNAVWNEQFHGDPRLDSEFVFLNGRRLRVLGVLAADFRFPDANIQAFVPFESSTRPMPGFEWPGVILRLRNEANIKSAKRQVRREADETRFPTPVVLNVASLDDIRYRAIEAWLAMAALAALFLIGFNWHIFRQLCTTSPVRSLGIHLKWWSFFAVKSGLLVALAWLFSVDLVQVIVEKAGLSAVRFAGGAATWVFVVTLWMVLSWSIRDQNSRCRFCLKRLRTAIVLGEAMFALLEPSGCDLFCESAHGMLHVPAMPLSSLDSERWIDFDDSWQILAQDASA